MSDDDDRTCPATAPQFGRDWEDWHRAHEARRADPHGFLAVTGLHWLGARAVCVRRGSPGPGRPDRTGPWSTSLATRRLTSRARPSPAATSSGVIPERGGVTVGFDGGVIEIAKRGGHDILRPRRPDHPFLATYDGTPTYVPNPRWRVRARFVAYDAPRPTEVGAAVDGLTHVYDAPGDLEFTLQGEKFRLVAFPGHGDGRPARALHRRDERTHDLRGEPQPAVSRARRGRRGR